MPPSVAGRHMFKRPTCAKETCIEPARCAGLWSTSFEGGELKAANGNELVRPEDFPRYRSALRDCFKGITRRLDCEYRVRHADGAYRWIEDRGVPVRNAARQAIRLVGALTDVTARKE